MGNGGYLPSAKGVTLASLPADVLARVAGHLETSGRWALLLPSPSARFFLQPPNTAAPYALYSPQLHCCRTFSFSIAHPAALPQKLACSSLLLTRRTLTCRTLALPMPPQVHAAVQLPRALAAEQG